MDQKMNDGDVIPRVIEVLQDELPVLRRQALDADTPLWSAGLLDSFALVALVGALERRFAVAIDVDSLALEQFESPRTIAALCAGSSTAKGRPGG
jgi:acyl carrier protein